MSIILYHVLLAVLLTNSESLINTTEKDIENLEKPDTALQRKMSSDAGNLCKVFMMLKLGVCTNEEKNGVLALHIEREHQLHDKAGL